MGYLVVRKVKSTISATNWNNLRLDLEAAVKASTPFDLCELFCLLVVSSLKWWVCNDLFRSEFNMTRKYAGRMTPFLSACRNPKMHVTAEGKAAKTA